MVEARSRGWQWADAWVLAAIPDPPGGSLSTVIGAADVINHAIPTRSELSRGIGALVAAGLVEVDGDLFRTTVAGWALKEHWGDELFEWSADLLPELNKLDRPDDEFPLTDDEVQQAYQRYAKGLRKS